MKRLLSEIIFEFLSWLIMLFWGINTLIVLIKKALITIWKRKEMVKKAIRAGYNRYSKWDEKSEFDEVSQE